MDDADPFGQEPSHLSEALRLLNEHLPLTSSTRALSTTSKTTTSTSNRAVAKVSPMLTWTPPKDITDLDSKKTGHSQKPERSKPSSGNPDRPQMDNDNNMWNKTNHQNAKPKQQQYSQQHQQQQQKQQHRQQQQWQHYRYHQGYSMVPPQFDPYSRPYSGPFHHYPTPLPPPAHPNNPGFDQNLIPPPHPYDVKPKRSHYMSHAPLYFGNPSVQDHHFANGNSYMPGPYGNYAYKPDPKHPMPPPAGYRKGSSRGSKSMNMRSPEYKPNLSSVTVSNTSPHHQGTLENNKSKQAYYANSPQSYSSNPCSPGDFNQQTSPYNLSTADPRSPASQNSNSSSTSSNGKSDQAYHKQSQPTAQHRQFYQPHAIDIVNYGNSWTTLNFYPNTEWQMQGNGWIMNMPLVTQPEINGFDQIKPPDIVTLSLLSDNCPSKNEIAQVLKHLPANKSFTQHWVIVGVNVTVLLLDFNENFSLLIPKVNDGQAFKCSNVWVEPEVEKSSLCPVQLLKFHFTDPVLEVTAPLVKDRNEGYRLLTQQMACVFGSNILKEIKPDSYEDHQYEDKTQQKKPQRETCTNDNNNNNIKTQGSGSGVYPELTKEESDNMLKCRFCDERFEYVCENLVHMKAHVADVSKVAELSLQKWLEGRYLKCLPCDKKTPYTLDYANHIDAHEIKDLACSICKSKIKSPKELAAHKETQHPEAILGPDFVAKKSQEVKKEQNKVETEKEESTAEIKPEKVTKLEPSDKTEMEVESQFKEYVSSVMEDDSSEKIFHQSVLSDMNSPMPMVTDANDASQTEEANNIKSNAVTQEEDSILETFSKQFVEADIDEKSDIVMDEVRLEKIQKELDKLEEEKKEEEEQKSRESEEDFFELRLTESEGEDEQEDVKQKQNKSEQLAAMTPKMTPSTSQPTGKKMFATKKLTKISPEFKLDNVCQIPAKKKRLLLVKNPTLSPGVSPKVKESGNVIVPKLIKNDHKRHHKRKTVLITSSIMKPTPTPPVNPVKTLSRFQDKFSSLSQSYVHMETLSIRTVHKGDILPTQEKPICRMTKKDIRKVKKKVTCKRASSSLSGHNACSILGTQETKKEKQKGQGVEDQVGTVVDQLVSTAVYKAKVSQDQKNLYTCLLRPNGLVIRKRFRRKNKKWTNKKQIHKMCQDILIENVINAMTFPNKNQQQHRIIRPKIKKEVWIVPKDELTPVEPCVVVKDILNDLISHVVEKHQHQMDTNLPVKKRKLKS